jgi:hypothetical protein
MAFLFQVKVTPLNPGERDRAEKKLYSELSRLSEGALVCAEVYENSINGFENRLLVVTRAFDSRLGKVGLAGIPDLYANRPNYPKMPRLIEREVQVKEIARFVQIKKGEPVRIGTKNGEEAVGRFHRADVEKGYPGISKLEIVLIGGTGKKPLEQMVQVSDVNFVEFVGQRARKREVFEPYEFR